MILYPSYIFPCLLISCLSQATGVIFILVCQLLEVPKHFQNPKCSVKDGKDGKVPDLQWAMYFMTSTAVAMAILFIYAFKPPYKRLDMERRKAAMKILNSGYQQRLPSVPSGRSLSDQSLSSPDEWYTFVMVGRGNCSVIISRSMGEHFSSVPLATAGCYCGN